MKSSFRHLAVPPSTTFIPPSVSRSKGSLNSNSNLDQNIKLRSKDAPFVASIANFLDNVANSVMSIDAESMADSRGKSIQSSTSNRSIHGVRAQDSSSFAASRLYVEDSTEDEAASYVNSIPLAGKSLLLLPPEHPLRLGLYHVLNSNGFARLMTFLIILNWAIYASIQWKEDSNSGEFGFRWQDYALLPIFIAYT